MTLVGQKAPTFNLPSTTNLETLEDRLSLESFQGRWLVLFFYPLDFTFVCPTEIQGFSAAKAKFKELDAEVVGCSVDSIYSHKAWIETPKEKSGLGPIEIPLLADFTKQTARDYGVLIEKEGVALRGTFIIDPDGVVRYEVVHDLNIGRNVEETLRVIAALQAGGLCPVNWQPGDKLL